MKLRKRWTDPAALDAEITALIEATRRGEIEPPNPDDFVDPDGRHLAQLMVEMVAKASERDDAKPGELEPVPPQEKAGKLRTQGGDADSKFHAETSKAEDLDLNPAQEPPEPEDAPEATTPLSEPEPARGAVSRHAPRLNDNGALGPSWLVIDDVPDPADLAPLKEGESIQRANVTITKVPRR